MKLKILLSAVLDPVNVFVGKVQQDGVMSVYIDDQLELLFSVTNATRLRDALDQKLPPRLIQERSPELDDA